jgi:hypothetical protein
MVVAPLEFVGAWRLVALVHAFRHRLDQNEVGNMVDLTPNNLKGRRSPRQLATAGRL